MGFGVGDERAEDAAQATDKLQWAGTVDAGAGALELTADLYGCRALLLHKSGETGNGRCLWRKEGMLLLGVG